MAQDTNIENLIINKLTKAQYESIANPDPAQLYFITDEVISSSDVVNALGYTPENVANKVTTLSSSSTDTQYPSAKAVYDQIANIDTLPSQTEQSGKFLTTDGTDASWGNLPVATTSTVGVVKPDNSSIRVDNDGTLSAICRNVGEIITSTLPLTDAGLHLLDGTRLSGDGIYGEFVQYIADLYTENPSANYFTDEASWQQSVTTYGVCGKFVYDSINNTVRLPKITGIIEGTTDVSALGDLVEAGLPNITGGFDKKFVLYEDTGTITGTGLFSTTTTTSNAYHGWSSHAGINADIKADASKANSIYGNSSTVQPQAIKAFYYIVIATSTKTDIQVDIDNIATDLNGKADVDLNNVPASKGILTESYVNGTSWYRIYSDGWCEQGGIVNANYNQTTVDVFLLKSYIDTNYSILLTAGGAAGNGVLKESWQNKTVSQFTIYGDYTASTALNIPTTWRACGYIR